MAVLFITSTRLGDAILSTGLLRWLLEHHPGEPVTIACGAPAAKAFVAVPGIAAIHVMEKRRRNGHWFDLWSAMRGRRWTRVVDLRRSLVSLLLRADRRHWMPRPALPLPRVELISRTLGLPPQAPTMWTAPDHQRTAGSILPDGPPVVALAPGAGTAPKTWPVGHFIELAERLGAADGPIAGARFVLVGAEQDRPVAAPLLRALPADRRIDALGHDVPTTYELLRRSTMFVGNDSAMMHLAAAAGIRTVGLFGPTDDRLYAPWGEEAIAVRTPASYEELKNVPADATPMAGLTPAMVLEAIARRWR